MTSDRERRQQRRNREDFAGKMYDHLKSVFGTGDEIYTHDRNAITYEGIRGAIAEHHSTRLFKYHPMFERGHVASSQAACFNLFLPIMKSGHAAEILSSVKPDIATIDTSRLDNGFCFEYWRENPMDDDSRGLLSDHSATSGTDADFALSYVNREKERCLWLIEHKLTEKEFTQCRVIHGGRHNELKPVCNRLTARDLVEDPNKCYYCSIRKFRYWQLTNKHLDIFPGLQQDSPGCPLMDGLFQLWRNILLAEEAGEEYGYRHVYFSVLRPEENMKLEKTLNKFSGMVKPGIFSVISPGLLIDAASQFSDKFTAEWTGWYRKTYLDCGE